MSTGQTIERLPDTELWLGFARRRLFTGGAFAGLRRRFGFVGVSFDADLFLDLLGSGADYGEPLGELLRGETGVPGTVEQLLAEDAAAAAAALAREFEASGGARGWVAVDLPGHVPLEPEVALAWWQRFAACAPAGNLMLKLPASRAGLGVAEALLAAGGSVWLQHVFSPRHVQGVLEAHRRGVEMALAAGHDPARMRAVAAINLLRLDVAVDEMLRDRARAQPALRDVAQSLLGRAGLAVATLARATVEEAARGSAWRRLAARGCRPIGVACEGVASVDPTRRDVDRIGRLTGQGYILVASRAVLGALGGLRAEPPVGAGWIERAGRALDDLREAGVPLEEIADGLQKAVARQAEERAAAVRNRLEAFREQHRVPDGDAIAYDLGTLQEGVAERLLAVPGDLMDRLWERDASIWPAGAADSVRERLGWLDLPEAMRTEALPVVAFARGSSAEGTPVVLLGMGGSSLGAEACRACFESSGFRVLDTTVPRGVAAAASRLPVERALFLVASKSGTTLETRALADYFHGRVAARSEDPGERFAVVTDPGTPLHELARRRGYRRVWLNPPDVGGRFSVLSYFGLVPVALMGLDVPVLLERARHMAALTAPEVPGRENPGLYLGVVLAEAAAAGVDKLTLLTGRRLSGLADWIEQLVAESLGKEGLGLVPVSGEPVGQAEAYGTDRMFVWYRFASAEVDEGTRRLLAAARERGSPVIEIVLADPYDLGREFFRWQVAVAVAGALLQINPFDAPDVRLAKQRTCDLIERFVADGSLDEPEPVCVEGPLALYADLQADPELGERAPVDGGLASWLGAHLSRIQLPEYFAIQAFLAPEMDTWRALQGLRALVRDRCGVATTLGWGPRFLHSTGQLHKGGPTTGIFLQLTADDAGDLEIPGAPYSFAVLARAQALGDLAALRERRRRVVRVHLSAPVDAALPMLIEAVTEGLEGPRRRAPAERRRSR